MRLLVIGDVGGHHERLRQLLVDAGADPEGATLPPETHVVQVGDLIDRGPDSAACVALADRFVASGAAWTQLLGNHEGNRIGGRRFWDEPLDAAALETLQRWWRTGQAKLAVALRTREMGDVLVTHAGLVAQLWVMMGRPDCVGAADRLNQAVGRDPELAFSSGVLLAGGVAGPAWADAARELYPSWISTELVPFGQVHGHSPVVAWPTGRAVRSVPWRLRRRLRPDPERQHSRIDIGGRPFVCVDPGLGFTPTAEHRLVPLQLTGEVIVTDE